MIEDRWEHGSDFHWQDLPKAPAPRTPWRGATPWASARGALAALAKTRGWRRLWVPSYFCQHTLSSLVTWGTRLSIYRDAPDKSGPDVSSLDCRRGDGLLLVNYFGLRADPALTLPQGVEVVEDHTHDPLSGWAQSSGAHWCLASLRKTAPLPVGAVLWSPRGSQPPSASVDVRAESAAIRKLTAMLLKRLYLEGLPVPKETYRRLALEAEEQIGSAAPSGVPSWLSGLLDVLPWEQWRRTRRANYDGFVATLPVTDRLSLLPLRGVAGAPYVVALLFTDRGRARRARDELIEARIYPPRLWDLSSPVIGELPESDRALSECLLLLHCDHRYNGGDMTRVRATLDEILAA